MDCYVNAFDKEIWKDNSGTSALFLQVGRQRP